MIYFDSAATTLIKPKSVFGAVNRAMQTCANPGRGGHKAAMDAAKEVFACRVAVSDFFKMENPENVVFTLNATHALNIAIKSVLKNGGHALTTSYEHNSVVRPLEAMKDRGVSYTICEIPLFCGAAAKILKESITEETSCVIVNHMSNAFGYFLPLEEIDEICFARGLPLIIDASQSAGIMDIDVRKLKGTHFICMPGHKSLYGPQGTGVLLCCNDQNLYSLTEGGTGSNSIELKQPDFLPDIFESGTPNVFGIAGLKAGVDFVSKTGTSTIREHKKELITLLASGLYSIKGIKPFYDPMLQNGLISFKADHMGSEELCQKLGDAGFCLRGGLHCSPLAHDAAGTLPDGTARVSFSVFNTRQQIASLLKAVSKAVQN